MFCAKCGVAVLENTRFCAACGAPLAAAAVTSGGAAAQIAPASAPYVPPAAWTPRAPAAPAAGPGMHPLAGIAIVVTLLLVGYAVVFLPIPPQPNAATGYGYRAGQALMALFLPLVIAYAVAGRRSARNPGRFATIFCTLALVLAGLNAAGNYAKQPRETQDQRIARLVREASSEVPPLERGGIEGELDALMRDMFRRVAQQNRAYQKAVDGADLRRLGELYSARSFSSEYDISTTQAQLALALQLDTQQEDTLRQLLADVRSQAERKDWPARYKRELLTGIDAGFAEAFQRRAAQVEAEKAWAAAAQDLYQYALEHLDAISVRGDQILIADSAVRDAFNLRLERAQQLQKDFETKQERFDNSVKQDFQKKGLTPQELEKLQGGTR
jgi:hypothetical protein